MFSKRLINKIGLLTDLQQKAIPRLVRALADDQTLTSLLKGPSKICAWSTWYRNTDKRKGWKHQPLFMEVLEEAKEEYRQQLLDRAVDDAAETLRLLTPLAADLAKLILVGVTKGKSVEGLPPALTELLAIAAGEGEEVDVSDRRQAARDVMAIGQKTLFDLLDRADVKTAIKQAGEGQEWRALAEELRKTGRPRRGMGEDADVADE